MTQADLFQALKMLGLPLAYGSFAKPVVPPFITYQFAYASDMVADNHNYLDISNFQIELYTASKDLATEKKVQDKLKELGLPYGKIETWIDEEKVFQILYTIQIMGG